ncbi:HpcH/HpaI aldolase/citrate lyase family protein [Candidatus Riflebacteria bacterium]
MKKAFITFIFCTIIFWTGPIASQNYIADKNSSQRSKNELISFVYHWFSMFDKQVDVKSFLPFLSENNLKMQFPEATLSSHADFRKWYQGIKKTIKKNWHSLERVQVNIETAGKYSVDLVVLWKAETFANKKITFRARQQWKIVETRGRTLQIEDYFVEEAGFLFNRVKRDIVLFNRPTFGGFVTIPNSKIIENFAVPGKLDFVWIEAEHTEMGPSQVQKLVIAAENENLVPIVRVPKNDIDQIKKYIGTGVLGVIIPSIKTVAEAKKAISALKYPPSGDRPAGVERGNRYLGYFNEYKKCANDEILAILMLETKEAVENIEEILKVKGIDILHMGPYDLSLSMGVDMKSAELKDAVAKVEKAAQRFKIPLGSYAPNLKSAREKAKRGYRFFTIPGDMQLLQGGVGDFFKE